MQSELAVRFQAHGDPLRVAVLCDFVEDNWTSMELVGDMLVKHLGENRRGEIDATRVRPPMVYRATRLAVPPLRRRALQIDQFINRFIYYPRIVRGQHDKFDLFHVVDHSYAQLVHAVPADRAIVTCHDLDAFRCLIQPEQHDRSLVFRRVAERILSGMKKAAHVTCDSVATHDEILAYGIIPRERLSIVQNGVHPSFRIDADAEADREAERLLGPVEQGSVDLLHVGTTIPRKRIDFLLRLLAQLRLELPQIRLIRVGWELTDEQKALLRDLGQEGALVQLPPLETRVLAAVYRRCSMLLLPSESEGFGLPVIESLSCGTPVVCSDLPVLREVGGDAATYRAVGDLDGWTSAGHDLVREAPHARAARRNRGLLHAGRFTWAEYARQMTVIYSGLLDDRATVHLRPH